MSANHPLLTFWPLIRMLVADPAARGRGIGRSLTKECLNRAERDAESVIALHTSPAMEAALKLYLDLGFKLHAPVPDRLGMPYAVYPLRLPPSRASRSIASLEGQPQG
jgi:ribosomal protein S18 acetylase RimI-like enzyme